MGEEAVASALPPKVNPQVDIAPADPASTAAADGPAAPEPAHHVEWAPKVELARVTPNRRRGGDLRVLLSPTTVGATTGFMGVATIEPGEFISEHYHPYSEEFIFLVRGTLTVRLDGHPLELAANESVMVPKNVRHRLENHGAAPAFIVFQLAPLAPRPDLGHVDTETLPNPDAPLPLDGARR
jgi:putative monooxygenase